MWKQWQCTFSWSSPVQVLLTLWCENVAQDDRLQSKRCFVSGYWTTEFVIYYILKSLGSKMKTCEDPKCLLQASQHDINMMTSSWGRDQRRFHTGPVVCIYCPWTVTALAWGTTICRTDSLRGGKWMLVFNVSVLDNRCQCWVREVTKAIFSWLIEPGTCLLQDVLPSFMWRCETNVLSTCDATWMLLQKRNQRHSMVCLCVSCHFVYVTFGLVSRNKHYGISRAPEL